jgi:peptide/nickel transport system permease protein
VSFVLNSLSPSDLARTMLGADGTQEQYLALRHDLGLDRSVLIQYASWLGNALSGDLGASYLTKERVLSMLNPRLGVTLSIMTGVMLVCVSLGLLFGVLSALRGGWIGKAIDVLSLVGLMMPSFLVALLFIMVFAVWLRWLPATGYVMFSQNPAGWLASLVLPILSVSFLPIANIAKQTRDGMNDVLRRDFIRALRASGVPERSIIWKHALRNAALPVITVLGLVMIGAISGTVFVERVFVLPGLGSLAVDRPPDRPRADSNPCVRPPRGCDTAATTPAIWRAAHSPLPGLFRAARSRFLPCRSSTRDAPPRDPTTRSAP